MRRFRRPIRAPIRWMRAVSWSLDSPLRAGAKINARFATEAIVGSSTESTDNSLRSVRRNSGARRRRGFQRTLSLHESGVPRRRHRQHAQHPVFPHPTGARQPAGIFRVRPRGRYFARTSPDPTDDRRHLYHGGRRHGQHHAWDPPAMRNCSAAAGRSIFRVPATLLGGSTAAGGHDIVIGVKAGLRRLERHVERHLLGRGPARRFQHRERILGRALGARTGQTDVEQTLQSAWRRRLRLHRHQRLFAGRRWQRNRRSHPGLLGAGGKAFTGAAINPIDSGAYEIYFGVQAPAQAGTGVFLNPLGVVNAASSAPAGNPISPGEFVTLYGTGLAKSDQTAVASVSGFPERRQRAHQ